MRLDLFSFGQHDRAVDDIPQLADVAGPGVIQQALPGGDGKGQPRPAVLPPVMVQERIDQQKNVIAPLAQRRQGQFENAEPVIEVFAELFFAYRLLQILVGGGDDTDVDGDFAGTSHRQKRVAFQNP